jgi:ABC-2 type transport system permease protein
MGNVLNVARKEFADLLSSRMVLIVLAAFLIYSIMVIYVFYLGVNGLIPGGKLRFIDNVGVAANNFVFFTLGLFGVIIGIVIGCSSISSERIGNALNTLVVKPVYRDTIINGKILGMLSFLACAMLFFTIIFTVMFLIFCGDLFAPRFSDYVSRLPFAIIVAMAYVFVFLSLSVLISLIVKDQAFAMILSTVAVYLSDNMYTYNIADYLNSIFPGYGLKSLCIDLSPHGLVSLRIQNNLMDTSLGAFDAFMVVLPQFTQLLVYACIFLALSYIIFIRSDLS